MLGEQVEGRTKQEMAEGQELPAVLLILVGRVMHLVEGYYNSILVGCRFKNTDLAWPVGNFEEDKVVMAEKNGARPVFLVDFDFGEMAIPFEVLPRAMKDWRNHVIQSSRNGDGAVDEALLVAKIRRFRVPEARARVLAAALASDLRPETTGNIWNRRVMLDLMPPSENVMPFVMGSLILGIFQGWQLADTILPDFASSPWFSIALIATLIGGMILMAWRN